MDNKILNIIKIVLGIIAAVVIVCGALYLFNAWEDANRRLASVEAVYASKLMSVQEESSLKAEQESILESQLSKLNDTLQSLNDSANEIIEQRSDANDPEESSGETN